MVAQQQCYGRAWVHLNPTLTHLQRSTETPEQEGLVSGDPTPSRSWLGNRNSLARLRRAVASSDWSLSICERGAVAPLSHFPPGHAGSEPEVRCHRFLLAPRRAAPRTTRAVAAHVSAMTPSGIVACSHRNPELRPFFPSVRPFMGAAWQPGKFKWSLLLSLLRAGSCGWSVDRSSESAFGFSYVLPFQSCARSVGESCIRIHDNGPARRTPRGLGRVAPRCGWA